MFKKFLPVVLVALSVLAFVSCTRNDTGDTDPIEPTFEEQEEYTYTQDEGTENIAVTENGTDNYVQTEVTENTGLLSMTGELVSTPEDFYAQEDEDGHWYIVCYTGDAENIVVPEVVDGRTVEYVSENMFEFEEVKRLIIEAKIKEIPDEFLIGHEELIAVSLPEGVEVINEHAFSGCTSLGYIQIPETLKSIKHYGFQDCSSLKHITLPEGMEEIGYHAFTRSGLQSITIPASVKQLEGSVFEDCADLKDVYISGADTKIGSNVFDKGEKVVIHGLAGSQAETFAKSYDYPFKTL